MNSAPSKAASIGALVLACLGTCLAPSAAQAQQVNIRVADFLPPTHVFYTCSMEKWVSQIDREAKDKIKINYMGGGKTVSGNEMLDGVRKGIADMGVMVVDYWPDRLNLASFSSLPYVFPDPASGTEILHKLMQGTMGENFRKEGIEPVMILLTTPRQMSLAKTKVRRLEDIKGLKLRANGWEGKSVEALGASIVTMSTVEGVTSQKTGIIDGATQTYYAMPGWGLMDITEQLVELRGYAHTLVVVGASTQKWNSWPKEVKDTLARVSRSVEAGWVTCQNDKDKEVVEQFKKKGVNIYTITDAELQKAKQLTKPVIDNWLAATGANGKKVYDEFLAATK
jgi:TRAP-type C4-dicarboxylate transport system substrate-binding protein